MAFEFKLPDLGEGIHEGEIVQWLVSEGETVAPEQHLVEVMTDKVTTELPSPVAGKVLRLHGEAGDVVTVGSVLVSIDTDGDRPAAPARGRRVREAAPKPAKEPAKKPRKETPHPGAVLAVPAVRRLAKELGVDLATLNGSGPDGRVLEADVRAAAPPAPAPARPAPKAPRPTRDGVRRLPLRGMRRTIAEHLLEGHRSTAPYTYVDEVDFTELVGLRERVQPLAEKSGVRLTYLPFILAAVSMALREHPVLNATVDPASGDLLVSEEHHLGVAVHTEDGLVVPVVRGVEQRPLLDVAREVERLSADARAGKLARDAVQGGTFTVSSLGPVGGLMGTPMLHTPQVAVLGVHRISPRPAVRDGVVVPRQLGNLSLTLDHRYIDGYVGASFAQTLKRYLEDPAVMLFSLAELREA